MNPPRGSIDLNADLGEGASLDELLLTLVSSASIACGAHAGNEAIARRTLAGARECGVAVGAHPGFADREGFGRRGRAISSAEAESLVLDQFAWLNAIALDEGSTLLYVKPHGALYNQAQRDPQIAAGILDAMARLDLPILGQPASTLAHLAQHRGLRFIGEGFPDRGYDAQGRLLARDQPGAILRDPSSVETQVLRLLAEGVRTLCIHGDDPLAVENARMVRSILDRHGLRLERFA